MAMKTVTIKGPAARNWFAEQLVKDYGADGALERTCGPMRKAVEAEIARCEEGALEHEYELGLLHG